MSSLFSMGITFNLRHSNVQAWGNGNFKWNCLLYVNCIGFNLIKLYFLWVCDIQTSTSDMFARMHMKDAKMKVSGLWLNIQFIYLKPNHILTEYSPIKSTILNGIKCAVTDFETTSWPVMISLKLSLFWKTALQMIFWLHEESLCEWEKR